jgi:hypothetical protein
MKNAIAFTADFLERSLSNLPLDTIRLVIEFEIGSGAISDAAH